jgi:hypothetical protein
MMGFVACHARCLAPEGGVDALGVARLQDEAALAAAKEAMDTLVRARKPDERVVEHGGGRRRRRLLVLLLLLLLVLLLVLLLRTRAARRAELALESRTHIVGALDGGVGGGVGGVGGVGGRGGDTTLGERDDFARRRRLCVQAWRAQRPWPHAARECEGGHGRTSTCHL